MQHFAQCDDLSDLKLRTSQHSHCLGTQPMCVRLQWAAILDPGGLLESRRHFGALASAVLHCSGVCGAEAAAETSSTPGRRHLLCFLAADPEATSRGVGNHTPGLISHHRAVTRRHSAIADTRPARRSVLKSCWTFWRRSDTWWKRTK